MGANFIFMLLHRYRRFCHFSQQIFCHSKYVTLTGSKKSIVSDFDKTYGNDVLQKASDKLHSRNRLGFPQVGVAVFNAEKDVSVFEFFDAIVGDGHPIKIRSQVL